MPLKESGVKLVAEGTNAFLRNMGKSSDAVTAFGKDAGLVSSAVTTMGGAVGSAAKLISGVALAGITAAAAATGAVMVSSTKLAIDFEQQVAILGVSARDTGLSLDELSDAALAVGGDTSLVGVSATSAADAMTGLFKAGLTTTEVFGDLQGFMEGTADLGGALRASIDLAAASELDMVQASEAAAVALATFGGAAESEAERAQFINDAMNNLVQSADAAVTSVPALVEALKFVGPSAAQAGFSIEDVNNALAILSGAGIEGSSAGTALDAAFRSLLAPTEQAASLMGDLGISMFDASGETLPLVDIIGNLETALIGMTDEQRAAAMSTLFTAAGQRGMNVLLDSGVEGWEDMADAVSSAASIQDQAAARTETFAGKMEGLEGAVETLKIGIGSALLPILTDMISSFSSFVDENSPMIVGAFETLATWISDNLPLAIQTLTDFWSNVLQPALVAFWDFLQSSIFPIISQLATWLQEVLPQAIAFVTEHWDAFKGALIAIGAVLAGAGIVTAIMGIIAALNPVTLIIGAIVAAAALLGAAWSENWGGIRDVLTQVWVETLQPALSELWSWLSVNIPIAIETLKQFWVEVLQPALETVWSFIVENVIPVMAQVVTWLATNIPVAIQTASNFWNNTLKPALEVVWSFITESVIPIFETVVTWLATNIPDAISTASDFWENTLKPALDAVWSFIDDNLIPIFESIVNLFDVALSVAIEGLALLWTSTLQPALEDVWSLIQDNVLPIFEELTDWLFGPGLDAVITFLSDGVDALTEGLQVLVTWLTKVKGWIDKLAAAVAAFSWGDVGEGAMPGSPPKLAIGFAAITEQVKMFGQSVAALQGQVASPLESIMPIAENKIEPDTGSGLDVESIWRAGPFASAAHDLIKGAFPAANNSPYKTGSQIVNNINNSRDVSVNFSGNYASSPTIRDRDDLSMMLGLAGVS